MTAGSFVLLVEAIAVGLCLGQLVVEVVNVFVFAPWNARRALDTIDLERFGRGIARAVDTVNDKRDKAAAELPSHIIFDDGFLCGALISNRLSSRQPCFMLTGPSLGPDVLLCSHCYDVLREDYPECVARFRPCTLVEPLR